MSEPDLLHLLLGMMLGSYPGFYAGTYFRRRLEGRKRKPKRKRMPRIVEVDMADEFQKMMLEGVAKLTPEERAEMQERMTALQGALTEATSDDPPRNLGDEFADAMADSVAVRCACGLTLTHMGLRESKGVCMKCGTRHRREDTDGAA